MDYFIREADRKLRLENSIKSFIKEKLYVIHHDVVKHSVLKKKVKISYSLCSDEHGKTDEENEEERKEKAKQRRSRTNFR